MQRLKFSEVISGLYYIKQKESESAVAQSCPTFGDPMNRTYQAPPSMGFSKQDHWSGLPFPSPGDCPNPGIKPGSPALQADVLPSESRGKSHVNLWCYKGKKAGLQGEEQGSRGAFLPFLPRFGAHLYLRTFANEVFSVWTLLFLLTLSTLPFCQVTF